jgi:hypothetical protein
MKGNVSMRKVSGVLLTAAMVLSVGMVAALPGGAAVAAKPTCKTLSGTATFAPALPKIGSPTKTKPVVTSKGGKLGGCTGGGVTGGTLGSKLTFGIASNCSSLLAGGTTNTKGTVNIVWNNKKTSTAAVTLKGVPKKATTTTIAGTITAGLFKASKVSVVIVFTPLKGGCTSGPLTSVTFKQVTPLTIK